MSTLVIDGHPDPQSLTAELARRYVAAHGDAELLAVRELAFDPNLLHGHRGVQELEPDIVEASRRIAAADSIVIATPVWWGSVPALLKGFFDRVLLRRWAFEYRRGLPVGLLKGRSGRVIITSDSPRWYLFFVGDTTAKHVRGTTLRFCGLRPVRLSRFTSVRTSTPAKREQWLRRIEADARADAARGARSTSTPSDPGPLEAALEKLGRLEQPAR